VAVLLGFGAFFAVNLSEYFDWRQYGRSTVENTRLVQEIFHAPMAAAAAELVAATAAAPHIPEEELDMSQFDGLIDALYQVRALTGSSDIVAYMYIPGTNISNVVMQAHNNSYYLRRDMFGNSNSNGSLFVDYRNRPCFTDYSTIIYGHNMNNGNMFHELRHYAFGDDREEFFRDRQHILVVTDTEVLIYEIFSVFTTRTYFDYIQVDFYGDEFAGLVGEFNRRRLYDTGVLASDDDNVLVLSTCSHVSNSVRIGVVGRLWRRIGL